MTVDKLTKEVSMERRMQKAETMAWRWEAYSSEEEEGLAGVREHWTVRWKDDWDNELWQEPWEALQEEGDGQQCQM